MTATIPTMTTARLRLRAPRLDEFEAYADFRASNRSHHIGGPLPRGEAFTHFTALAERLGAVRERDPHHPVFGPIHLYPHLAPGARP